MEENGKLISDDPKIAELFNNYFINITQDLINITCVNTALMAMANGDKTGAVELLFTSFDLNGGIMSDSGILLCSNDIENLIINEIERIKGSK